jgi:hypothetical protein
VADVLQIALAEVPALAWPCLAFGAHQMQHRLYPFISPPPRAGRASFPKAQASHAGSTAFSAMIGGKEHPTKRHGNPPPPAIGPVSEPKVRILVCQHSVCARVSPWQSLFFFGR